MLEPNYLRKGEFTDLTLKFGEVVRRSNALYLFLDFTINPSAQTFSMNHTTTALTVTRRNQRIILRLLVT